MMKNTAGVTNTFAHAYTHTHTQVNKHYTLDTNVNLPRRRSEKSQ